MSTTSREEALRAAQQARSAMLTFENDYKPFFYKLEADKKEAALFFGWRPEHDTLWFKIKEFVRRRIFRRGPKKDDPRYFWTPEELERVNKTAGFQDTKWL